MSPSNSTEPHQPDSAQQLQIPESRSPIYETLDSPADTKTAGIQENPKEDETPLEQHPEEPMTNGDGDAEEEEEGECGFCLFMKGGGCKETFVEWEKCIEEAEKKEEDIVQKCFQVTTALKKCMEANSDYYAPILQAEKSLEEEAVKQLEEEEKEKEKFSGEESEKKEVS
ncbi:hypothetical protein AAHA92_29539 [Salvia divinorum]|uniref:GCK domain-containing protein n=1 Tax=Salvia divinorum TaxID=28513 RepID=A0ABD1FZ76_SALDI